MSESSGSSNSLHTIEDLEIEDPTSNFNLTFSYIDWDSSPNIIRAVLMNDIDRVRDLLVKKPNSIDSRDQLNNSPLHIAYIHQNLEIINLLASHPDVNLESENYEGETPLMKSIGKTSDAVIIKLLEAGCNVNTQDSVGRTPLHVALNFQRAIVEELLKRGADLNAPCGCGGSALFHAINISSLELVCMLLCYNADTSITNDINITPFLHSLNSQFDQALAYEILPYVVDFSPTNSEGLNCLSVAVHNLHPIAMDILEVIDYECLNQVDFKGFSALYYSLFHRNNVLFKELFSRIDHNILLKSQEPFLSLMCRRKVFNELIWLECFYLLASSDIFADLMNVYLIYLGNSIFGIFSILLRELDFDIIPQDDREKIIYIFLSFGEQVSDMDVINYYYFFGPCNEINIFLSSRICEDSMSFITYHASSSFLPYIFGKEVRKQYFELKNDILAEINCQFSSRNLVNILKFFTFRFMNIYEYIYSDIINITEIGLEKFQVPSLLELCRNEVRFTIRNSFGITTTNEFYETVEKLRIPKKIKDLILFKIPLR